MAFFELVKAFVYGVVEGITEWLPISSTGHLIILNKISALELGSRLSAGVRAEYWEMFEVVIQLGAISAIVFLFFDRLFPIKAVRKNKDEAVRFFSLWTKIAVASVPSALVGLAVDPLLKKVTGQDINDIFYTPSVVALMLIFYGILFIVSERKKQNEASAISDVSAITVGRAFLIGVFQMLAIIPGTSRSGATILGGRVLGLSRMTASEFSFFMAIPAMAGAGAVKTFGYISFLGESGEKLPFEMYLSLFAASVTAFAVSMLSVKFLLNYIQKHSFCAFGIYRIVLGIIVLLLNL